MPPLCKGRGTARGGGRVVKIPVQGAGSCCAAEVWGLRKWWKGCQNDNNPVGTPTEVCADLQPLSHLTVPALPRHAYVCHRHYSGALTQGSLYGVCADPFSGTDQSLPCARRRKLPCSGGVGTACGGGRVVKRDADPCKGYIAQT